MDHIYGDKVESLFYFWRAGQQLTPLDPIRAGYAHTGTCSSRKSMPIAPF